MEFVNSTGQEPLKVHFSQVPRAFVGRSFYITITLADIIDHEKYPETKPFLNQIDIRVEVVDKFV